MTTRPDGSGEEPEAAPVRRVFLHLGGEYLWLDAEEARRRLGGVSTRACPKCAGRRTVQAPVRGRCDQCQGLGKVLA